MSKRIQDLLNPPAPPDPPFEKICLEAIRRASLQGVALHSSDIIEEMITARLGKTAALIPKIALAIFLSPLVEQALENLVEAGRIQLKADHYWVGDD